TGSASDRPTHQAQALAPLPCPSWRATACQRSCTQLRSDHSETGSLPCRQGRALPADSLSYYKNVGCSGCSCEAVVQETRARNCSCPRLHLRLSIGRGSIWPSRWGAVRRKLHFAHRPLWWEELNSRCSPPPQKSMPKVQVR